VSDTANTGGELHSMPWETTDYSHCYHLMSNGLEHGGFI